MSYKRLGDPKRQVALDAFLSAAAQLDGHLVAIAVDKKKKWLSTQFNSSEETREMLGLKCAWHPLALEDMIRKIQIVAILLSLWSKPGTNVTWITDQDAFVANDKRHDDALTAVARMTSLYNSHPKGVFRLNTTDQDEDSRDYEDLCAIPDLAAGMIADVTMRLVAHEGASLGQNLKDVPVRSFHGIKDTVDELCRDLLMEKVTHRIDEDHAWPLPAERLPYPLGAQCEIKAIFKWMPWDSPPAFCKALGVAIVAAASDLRASGDRIPRRIGPFNCASVRHDQLD